MKVKFINAWFARTDVYKVDAARVVSGKLYRKGHTYELPDEMLEYLPKSAVVLDENGKKKKVEKKIEKEPSLKDFDNERAASDAVIAVAAEADKRVGKVK